MTNKQTHYNHIDKSDRRDIAARYLLQVVLKRNRYSVATLQELADALDDVHDYLGAYPNPTLAKQIENGAK